jgi:phosphoribosylanthranilate isomerase
MFVKVCGITRLEDAMHAVESGATALGFVFWSGSPRRIEPARAASIVAALGSGIATVGVFVNESIDGIRRAAAAAGVSHVQLHGDEPPAYADALAWPILRAVTLDGAASASEAWPSGTTLLVDAADPVRRGGTGVTVDWPRAAALARTRRLVLAGGLTPHNVADAIAAVRPFGVDVSSGVEQQAGIKDPAKVARFVASAREAFEQYERRDQ